MDIQNEIKQHVAAKRAEIIQFMRDICAIPSMDSLIGPVGERIQAEMRKPGYDERTAHTIQENVPHDEVVSAAEFYAYLPKSLKEMAKT